MCGKPEIMNDLICCQTNRKSDMIIRVTTAQKRICIIKPPLTIIIGFILNHMRDTINDI